MANARETLAKITDAIKAPTVDELRSRLATAQQALVAAQSAKDAAETAQEAAYAVGSDDAARQAQSDVIRARLDAERAAGRVVSLERALAAAVAVQDSAALAESKATLAALTAARVKAGSAIVKALDALADNVAKLHELDQQLVGVPVAVLGRNFIHGINSGAGQFQAHLGIELAQRGIAGTPSSRDVARLTTWLRTGNDLLALGAEQPAPADDESSR